MEEQEIKHKKYSIKESSPFNAHYTDIYKDVLQLIQNTAQPINDSATEKNVYYKPIIITKLVSDIMPYAFYFIGFMFRGTGLTRLTNGILEQYQGFRKVNFHLHFFCICFIY